MRRPPLRYGALLGGVTTLALIALFFLGEQFAGLPFVPFDLFDWLARVLPGDVITLGIDGIVRTINALNLGPTSDAAKFLEQLMGIGLVLGVGTLAGLFIAWALQRTTRQGWRVGAAVGVALFFLSLLVVSSVGFFGDPTLSILWMAVLFVGWGGLLGSWLDAEPVAHPVATGEARATRRAMLTRVVGGSFAVALASWGFGRVFGSQASESGASQPLASVLEATPQPPASGAEVAPLPQIAQEPTAPAIDRRTPPPAPGTRPELTSNDDFYRIDINARPVVINQQEWELVVDGLFETPRTFTLAELMAYPAVTQTVTMGCISNRVGGDLIGTSNWTGLSLRALLEELGISPVAQVLYMESADGFYESIAREDFMDERAMLVYGMNGETLPVEHGFPLRIYIPDRYGMKQPKWITRMEAVPEWQPGYWVERGWSREARPQIVSVIDTIAVDAAEDGVVPVGGIAWAGDRGIWQVEVQVDDGAWEPAALRTPPLSALTWVQWRYDWPATPGRHTLRVRAMDGTSTLQTSREQGVRPDGATGYHSRTVTI